MTSPWSLEEFSYERDLHDVIAMWERSGPGIQLRESDQPEEILKKLERDPDLFLVARDGNKVIGAVMGGFDGRRGFIYHLAVDGAFRQKGVGSRLLFEVERRLKQKGCLKVNLLVSPENSPAAAFYLQAGYERMNVLPFGKKLI